MTIIYKLYSSVISDPNKQYILKNKAEIFICIFSWRRRHRDSCFCWTAWLGDCADGQTRPGSRVLCGRRASPSASACRTSVCRAHFRMRLVDRSPGPGREPWAPSSRRFRRTLSFRSEMRDCFRLCWTLFPWLPWPFFCTKISVVC